MDRERIYLNIQLALQSAKLDSQEKENLSIRWRDMRWLLSKVTDEKTFKIFIYKFCKELVRLDPELVTNLGL